MTIETKLNLGDTCFFLMLDKVREAVIESIETNNSLGGSYVYYIIDQNDAGEQYAKRLSENEVHKTKQDLLNSL